MQKALRKYHRALAVILCLPLFFTILSGLLITFIGEWFQNPDLANTMREIHTLEIIGLENYFPLLNGLGLLGLLATGISMTSLFRKRPAKSV